MWVAHCFWCLIEWIKVHHINASCTFMLWHPLIRLWFSSSLRFINSCYQPSSSLTCLTRCIRTHIRQTRICKLSCKLQALRCGAFVCLFAWLCFPLSLFLLLRLLPFWIKWSGGRKFRNPSLLSLWRRGKHFLFFGGDSVFQTFQWIAASVSVA